jgi:hypothetical protein
MLPSELVPEKMWPVASDEEQTSHPRNIRVNFEHLATFFEDNILTFSNLLTILIKIRSFARGTITLGPHRLCQHAVTLGRRGGPVRWSRWAPSRPFSARLKRQDKMAVKKDIFNQHMGRVWLFYMHKYCIYLCVTRWKRAGDTMSVQKFLTEQTGQRKKDFSKLFIHFVYIHWRHWRHWR